MCCKRWPVIIEYWFFSNESSYLNGQALQKRGVEISPLEHPKNAAFTKILLLFVIYITTLDLPASKKCPNIIFYTFIIAGNILLIDKDEKPDVMLIDYEYSSYNYRCAPFVMGDIFLS